MALTKLQFNPGINREVTPYAGGQGWFDGNHVRFRFGQPQKIGGWTKAGADFSYHDTCRKIFTWLDLDHVKLLALGTTSKLYVKQGDNLHDITPVRATQAAGSSAVTFAKVANSDATITVSDTAHGALKGDFVTFSGAASLGGNIVADVLNQEYEITEYVDADTYRIEARTASTIPSILVNSVITATPVLAAAGDSGNGGANVQAIYKNTTGLSVAVDGDGWDAGAFNEGTWNTASTVTGESETLRVWSIDNFGEDLVICAKGGGIFYWDTSAKKGSMGAAINLSEYSGVDNYYPTKGNGVLVTQDLHIVVWGATIEANPSVTQDPLLIRFSDQKNPAAWQTVAGTNTAGSLQISSGNKIVTCIETKQEILVLTDASAHSMQFQGPPFTFGQRLISNNITITGTTGAVAVDDTVYWMGMEEFYVYNGAVQTIPCTVRDYIFDDFNVARREMVVAGSNTAYDEVWWFYPSGVSLKNDRYVIYNIREQVWSYGNLEREAWLDRSLFVTPLAAKDGFLFEHENGFDDAGSALPAFIESADLEIEGGENVSFISRVVPDISFRDSSNNSATATFTIKSKDYPGNNYNEAGSQEAASSAQKDADAVYQYGVDSYTDKIDVRVRGRSFKLKIETSETGVEWRLGHPRIDIKPDGRR